MAALYAGRVVQIGSSSELTGGLEVVVGVERAVLAVGDFVAAAMQPVSAAIATTLSQPAARRARRAGWGRFRPGAPQGTEYSTMYSG